MIDETIVANVSASDVARKAAKSTVWTYFSYILSKGVNLLTTTILARLLTQAQFGIVGFALTAMTFLDAVRDAGVQTAFIQRRTDIEQAAHTAFWLTLFSNTAMWLLSIALALPVAEFFHEPLIRILLPVLSFSFVISSFGSIQDCLLKREMRFSRRVIPDLGESVVKCAVSVLLALSGGGVWALVVGQLAGRAAFTAIAWFMVQWRPGIHFSWEISKDLLRYGYKISIVGLISAFQANIDYVFVGHFLGDAQLGLYTIAYRIPEMIIINMCIVVAEVLLPAYSMLQHNLVELRQAMLMTLRYISLVTLPVGTLLAVIAIPLIRTLFGDRWQAAGPCMALLCLYGTVITISWNIGDVYKAIGRPDIMWKTGLFEFALLAAVLYILAQQSIVAVSLGQLVVALLTTTLRLAIATFTLKVPISSFLAQFVPSGLGSIALAVGAWLILAATTQLPGFISLILASTAGLAIYALIVWRFERELFTRMMRIIGTAPDKTSLVVP